MRAPSKGPLPLLLMLALVPACPGSGTDTGKTAAKADAKSADAKKGDAKKRDAKDAKKADAKRPDAKGDAKADPTAPPDRPPPPQLPPETERAVAASINAFAFDLHRELGAEPGNVFVSPASIAIAFAMTHAGAKGKTAEELAKTFHYGDAGNLHAGLAGTLARWDASAEGFELDVANRLFGEKTVAFEPAFLDVTKSTFAAPLEPVDFKGAFEPSRLHINAWVAEQTRDKIEDLLPSGALNETTRLVLANAIYFKAQWAEPFHGIATREAPFHGIAGDENVQMMNRIDVMRIATIDPVKARLLEIPYVGYEFAMTIVLPDDPKGLAKLEKAMTPETLQTWIDGAPEHRVDFKIPRFRIEPTESIALRKTLEKLGVVTAWQPGKADFTGIAPATEQLAISEAFHKAFIAVDEAGTEAAAATAISARAGSAMPTTATQPFVADHPFVFVIRDTKTGAILFMGRFADPA